MKMLFFIVFLSLIVLSCMQPSSGNSNGDDKDANASGAEATATPDSIKPTDLLTLADAEKILGERVYLTDTSTQQSSNATTYHYAYKAFAADAKTKKTGAIYFLAEYYKEADSARKKYTTIMKANEDHGITALDGLGDEAYFHTDNENFYFIMARKGNKVITMKVNKITNTTSLDEFNRIAKKIAANL